jgi:cytoskeletal protein CcmA (bactofilin family)
MTRIGPSFVICGEFESQEATVIEGRVDGFVYVKDAPLTITARGAVKADVRGTRVLVEGQLKGSISASERIELTPTAQVEGSLSADSIVMLEGARFTGGIDMNRRTLASKIDQYRAGHGAVPGPVSGPHGAAAPRPFSKA